MTDLKTQRAALVLILGIIAGGLVGMRLAISELPESEMGYAVGATAMVTFTLTALALIRRSWARLPLLVTGYLAGDLVLNGFFPENDPSAMVEGSLGYLFFNLIFIFFAGLALVVLFLDRMPMPSKQSRTRGWLTMESSANFRESCRIGPGPIVETVEAADRPPPTKGNRDDAVHDFR